MTEFIASRQSPETLPLRPVVLTFDDGFADSYEYALPVLTRYGFRATLYVITGLVGSKLAGRKRGSEGGRPMLTWEQIAEISASGIECGAHSIRRAPSRHDDGVETLTIIRMAGGKVHRHPGAFFLPDTTAAP